MKPLNKLRDILWQISRPPHGRDMFLKKLANKNGTLLDVGCGNDSSYRIKTKYPDIKYTGIDIGDYNQTKPILADRYILTSPDTFAEKIAEMENTFDTVISAHNLEHVNNREETLIAMTKTLRGGGVLYLSFPTAKSINFPGPREGTLNYFDDKTHKNMPPDFDKVIMTLKRHGMKILFSSRSYKPFIMYLIGFFLEWKSKRRRKIYSNTATWAYWGFESIIWAKKL